MDFAFNEEQEMFRRAVREFAQKEVTPLIPELEEKHLLPKSILEKAGNLGYLCPALPEKYGGGGMDMVAQCSLNEEIAKVDLGVGEVLLMPYYLGSFLSKYANEQQKQKYLIPSVKGKVLIAFALTEAVGGSNPAAIETVAVKKGNKYILKGSKTFITAAAISDYFLVYAYTDKAKGPRDGMSAFIVEADRKGVSRNMLKKVGSHGSSEAELFFDDVELPSENLIGEENKAWHPMFEFVNEGRLLHSARALGLAQAALEFVLDYAKQRVVFGKPIASHQAISFKFARMATQIEAVRSLVYRSAWMCDQKSPDFGKHASMSKFLAAETAVAVTNEAMQIQGGYALMMDSPLQRYWRDARFMCITEGTLEMLQIVITRSLGIK